MIRYSLGRLLSLIVSLFVASLVIFSVIEVIPGDPASFMLGINAREDTLAALRSEMGLDQPLVVRYLDWISGLLVGDFGNSWTYKTPVSELISDRIW
ncbi:MAG: ABC transporter permease, partial [Rhodobacterales bacterium]